jgi:hypothetical protein
MNRDRIRAAAVLALALLALGTAASTLDSGSLPEGDAERPNGSLGGGNGSVAWGSGGQLLAGGCPLPWVDRRLLGAVLAGTLLAGTAAYRRRTRELYAVSALGGVVTLGLAMLCPSLVPSVAFPGLPAVPPRALLAGGVAALLGAAVFLYARTGGSADFEMSGSDPEPEPDLAGVGAAAGEAADRLERHADVENEVYRAWREMAGRLEVSNPEATAPAEFAEAAVAAGMAETDVNTLTRLFEEVRYGEREAEPRAEDAVAALRRIERSYAEEGR